ncbi:uncharacterized protein LOC129582759 [Paramacrobiotus metropolitanus]|uniref:uncharacterized protein LOC129582759 n=1 Tax=Paramacrobiotus metropolitanus TaxID=2943436 RepID=UPI00244615C5|nr:uncharacterized protein LOC129582759 [Paramacrobiotus metropolitanus]
MDAITACSFVGIFSACTVLYRAWLSSWWKLYPERLYPCMALSLILLSAAQCLAAFAPWTVTPGQRPNQTRSADASDPFWTVNGTDVGSKVADAVCGLLFHSVCLWWLLLSMWWFLSTSRMWSQEAFSGIFGLYHGPIAVWASAAGLSILEFVTNQVADAALLPPSAQTAVIIVRAFPLVMCLFTGTGLSIAGYRAGLTIAQHLAVANDHELRVLLRKLCVVSSVFAVILSGYIVLTVGQLVNPSPGLRYGLHLLPLLLAASCGCWLSAVIARPAAQPAIKAPALSHSSTSRSCAVQTADYLLSFLDDGISPDDSVSQLSVSAADSDKALDHNHDVVIDHQKVGGLLSLPSLQSVNECA